MATMRFEQMQRFILAKKSGGLGALEVNEHYYGKISNISIYTLSDLNCCFKQSDWFAISG